MYVLNTTVSSLQFDLDGSISTSQPTIVTSYEDRRTDAEAPSPGSKQTTANNTTNVTIVEAPTTGVSRAVNQITIYNADTASISLNVYYVFNGTEYSIFQATLLTLEQAYYEYRTGWTVLDVNGNVKHNMTEAAQDAVGSILVDTDTINFTYTDATPEIKADLIVPGTNAGDIIYRVDGDTISAEAAFNYAASTNILTVDNIKAATNLTLQASGNHVIVGGGATASEIRLLEPSGSGTNYTAIKAQAQAGNVTYTLPAADATVSGYALKSDAAGTLSWGPAGGEELKKSVNQSTHGFSVGDVVYFNGTIYALADASAESTAEVAGIVSAVADTNNFTLLYSGYISGLSGLTSGAAHFLSETAGDLTATEPTTAGAVSKPLLIGLSTTTGLFFNMRGQVVGGDTGEFLLAVPQGRLTLTTATPVMTAEAAAQTTIYYTPYVGNQIPLYNGSAWANTIFTELSIAMAGDSDWAAGKNFDVFVFNDAGTIRLVTGAAWTNDTTRAEALARLNGLWTNSGSITGRYGAASTVTVPANQGTYVGTFRTTASAGTTTWELGGLAATGDPGFLYVWNAYHRVEVSIAVRDSTDSWTYALTTWRATNANTTMRVTFVRGLDEDDIFAAYSALGSGTAALSTALAGTNLDSTSATPLLTCFCGTDTSAGSVVAPYVGKPGLGLHYVQAMEASTSANTVTLYGDVGAPTTYQTGMIFKGPF